jgi:hypothetical protein
MNVGNEEKQKKGGVVPSNLKKKCLISPKIEPSIQRTIGMGIG